MSDNTLHRVSENSPQMCSSKDAVKRSNKQRGETKYHWMSLKNKPNHTQGLRSSLNGGQLRPSVHTQRCQRANLHNRTHNLRHMSCPNTRREKLNYSEKFKTIDLNSRSRNMNSVQILTYFWYSRGRWVIRFTFHLQMNNIIMLLVQTFNYSQLAYKRVAQFLRRHLHFQLLKEHFPGRSVALQVFGHSVYKMVSELRQSSESKSMFSSQAFLIYLILHRTLSLNFL